METKANAYDPMGAANAYPEDINEGNSAYSHVHVTMKINYTI